MTQRPLDCERLASIKRRLPVGARTGQAENKGGECEAVSEPYAEELGDLSRWRRPSALFAWPSMPGQLPAFTAVSVSVSVSVLASVLLLASALVAAWVCR